MAWMGKLFGGTLGFMFGGPLGMIAGIAFGHMFDKAGSLSPGIADTYQASQDQSQMMFFVGAFSMLARIASVDGTVTANERQKVQEFIHSDLHLGLREEEAAWKVFDAALIGEGTFEQFASQFHQNFAHAPNILQLMLDIFYRVASADGRVTSSEEALIRRAALIFRLPVSYVDALSRNYGGFASAGERSYAILGLTKTATNEEVKRAYRKMSIEFHPDTLAAKGMGEEFLTHATAKFREIQDAYNSIKQERGMR